MLKHPLEGVLVVALEQAVAAPFASRQLADLGARVIKVERPEGDFARGYDATVNGLSSHFVWLNRSKESLMLNLKQTAERDALLTIIARADVFIQNLAPGAAARLGLGADALRETHPRLIVCNVSGYGDAGPYRDKKAYDLLIQSETGLLSVTGDRDQPAKTGISTADIAAGMYAYSGILTALYRRERSGQGATLNVSMFDALGEWMGYPAYYTVYGGAPPPRSGAAHATIFPYGPFRAGDGAEVMLGIQNEREWRAFCTTVLERPELADDDRYAGNAARQTHRDELQKLLDDVFGTLNGATLVERLDTAGIANARVNGLQEFWNHPQHDARGRRAEVGSPVGPLQTLLPPVIMDDVDARLDPIPAVGEHSEAILREFGCSL